MALSALLWMSALWFQLREVKSDYIDTSIGNEYQDGEITCSSTENCTVLCDTSSGCYNTDIFCPTNYSCLIQCIASTNSLRNNCRGARIHCPTNGQCDVKCEGAASLGYACTEAQFFWPTTYPYSDTYTLECSGGYSCQKITIVAPDDYTDFSFACSGGGACSQSAILCPKYANCDIECTSSYSCNFAFAVWPITGIGNVFCGTQIGCYGFNYPPPHQDYTLICDSSSNCRGAIIECPTNANCDITCDGLYACKETSFIWSLNSSITSSLTCTPAPLPSETCLQTIAPPIYASNNETDFNLTCGLSECYGAYILCPTNAECHIHCDGDYSCAGASIVWPNAHPYSLTCNGAYSCARIDFTPYNDGNTSILAFNDDHSFYESVLNCPPNTECNVTCSGTYSCARTKINCALNALCNMFCTNTYACQYSQFNGLGRILSCDGIGACASSIFPLPPSSEMFALNCNTSQACYFSTIYCPTNAECHILCDNGNLVCKNTLIVWPSNTNMSSTLFCGTGYSDVCTDVNPPPHHIYYVDSLSCSGAGECQGAVIHCPFNAECFVSCDGDYACSGAIFSGAVYATCGEYKASCHAITMNARDNNADYTINCNSNSMCWRSTINCPSNASCNIICNGQNSCGELVINGPINNALTVNCSHGCPQRIYAQQSSSFILWGCSSGMSIWFPPKNANGDSVAVIDGANNLCMQYTKYYAINGWDDIQFINYVDIINFNQRINDRVNRIFCTSDYSAMCYFAYDSFECAKYGDQTCQFTLSQTEITTSPTGITSSPTGITTSPTGITTAPTGSPTEITISPTGITTSPTGITTAPTAVTTSPTGITTAPTAVTIAPTGITTPPTGITTPPTGNTASPTGVTTPPAFAPSTVVVSASVTGSTPAIVATKDFAIHSKPLCIIVFIVFFFYNM